MKIMKSNIWNWMAAGALFIGVTSCESILDLEPAQSLSNEVALADDTGVKQTLIGAYDRMAQSGILGGDIYMNADLYAGVDDLEWVGTYESYKEIYNRDILVNNAAVQDLWETAYEVTNTCNNILNALDVVDAADRDRVEGEALALRAWCLFELTRMFGHQYEAASASTDLAVPIVLEPTLAIGENSEMVRNTVEECYNQVIADLEAAQEKLPEKNDEFINTYVASALLARVYLQKEDYENARDAADRVIGSNDFELLADVAEAYGQDEATDEDVFSVEISTLDGTNDLNEYYALNDFGGRSDVEILDAFFALYDPADARSLLFVVDGDVRYTSKFNNEFGNISAIRIAEMYLIRAECNQRLGTAVGADPVDDYNMVHTRAGLPEAVSVTLDDILFERRLELAFEGFRVHDIKRTKGMIGTMNYDDPKMIYPIPQIEIEKNPLLVQNEGY